MLAILDSRLQNKIQNESINNHLTTNKDNFQPIELIRSLIQLPQEFLCNTGYIYENIFKHPPTSIVREALQLLVKTAMEKSPAQLDIEQINLAIKQLRLDSLMNHISNSTTTNTTSGSSEGSSNTEVEKELQNEVEQGSVYDTTSNTSTNNSTTATNTTTGTTTKPTAAEETLRLQILIELVRIHIVTMNKNNNKEYNIQNKNDENIFHQKENIQQEFENNKELKKEFPFQTMNMNIIEKHLTTPLKIIYEQTTTMSIDDIEFTNSQLKPYLKQLSSLKTHLTIELKDLKESRAFLALGLHSNATENEIKKAYRKLAIKYHPDKIGGNTILFQQLHDYYQEILIKNKNKLNENIAKEEVRNRYRNKSDTSKNSNTKNPSNEYENENKTHNSDDENDIFPKFNKKEKNKTPVDDSDDEGFIVEEREEEIEGQEQGECGVNSGSSSDSTIDPIQQQHKEQDGGVQNTEQNTEQHTEQNKEQEQKEDQNIENTNNNDDTHSNTNSNSDIDSDYEDNIEELMKGLDGTEDMNEVFRRLAEVNKKRTKKHDADTVCGGSNNDNTEEFNTKNLYSNSSNNKNNTSSSSSSDIYENETEHAQAILYKISLLLQKIKNCSTKCTRLAQYNIRWYKSINNYISSNKDNSSVKEVLKYINASSGIKCLIKNNKNTTTTSTTGSSGSTSSTAAVLSNIEICSLQQAVLPVENICEYTQQITTLAMELPNCCGVRYAATAANNKNFLLSIEKAMHLSLGALKTVLALINTQEQLGSCVRRVKDSQKIAGDSREIEELLLEMVKTAVKSNVITITSAGM